MPYIIFYFATTFVAGGVMYWICTPLVSVGMEAYVPKPNATTYTIAGTAFLLVAIWQSLANPLRPKHPWGLKRETAVTVIKALFSLNLISVTRFALPLLTSWWAPIDLRLGVFETVLWLLLLGFGGTLYRAVPLLTEHAIPTAEEVLAADHRQPVLYFRSYEKERKRASRVRQLTRLIDWWNSSGGIYLGTSFGEAWSDPKYRMSVALDARRMPDDEQLMFTNAFTSLGPYIALGRPDEKFKDMDIGAAKKYVAHDHWQDAVWEWLVECRAVVIEAADSVSLGWEIAQVVAMIPPTNVLVICPYNDDEYYAFRFAYGEMFPRGIPETRPRSRLLVFEADWRPLELKNIDLNLCKSLEPFIARILRNDA